MAELTKSVRIVLTGGGSGGHIYPLFAVAEELRAQAPTQGIDLELIYMGPDDPWSASLGELGIPRRIIAGPKLRRGYGALQNVLDIPKFFIALVQAWWKLFILMPDAVFSKGGPGALPVIMLAWFYRIPIMIHESDAEPGLTNLISSRFAQNIAVSFESAVSYFNPRITMATGNPIRRILRQPPIAPPVAKRELGFAEDRPLLVVLGGSQGSASINEFVAVNLEELLQHVQILHQTGTVHFMEIQKLTHAVLMTSEAGNPDRNRYVPLAFFDKEMPLALSAADVVLSRAGSSAVSEIASFGKPAILVPHAAGGNGHQRANAYALAKTGAAIVMEEANFRPGIFLGELMTLLGDSQKLSSMSAAALAFVRPDAAERIAKSLLDLAQKPA